MTRKFDIIFNYSIYKGFCFFFPFFMTQILCVDIEYCFFFLVGLLVTAVYATTSLVESVRKAQEENSTALLSRALKMCKEKPVILELLYIFTF